MTHNVFLWEAPTGHMYIKSTVPLEVNWRIEVDGVKYIVEGIWDLESEWYRVVEA